MNRILTRAFMASGVVLVSGAMVMAQQRPMQQGSPQQTNPTTANPNTNPNYPDNGQQAQMQQDQSAAMHSMQDKEFVKKAAEGGMAEVRLGQLAEQKSNSPDVKEFAQKMVNEHTQLNEQMEPIAQQMGVSSPKDLSKKDKKAIEKMENLSGRQFDDAYIKYMVKDHKKDLSDFRDTANRTQNTQLKTAAEHGAQVIQQHLQDIEQIAKNHNVEVKGSMGL